MEWLPRCGLVSESCCELVLLEYNVTTCGRFLGLFVDRLLDHPPKAVFPLAKSTPLPPPRSACGVPRDSTGIRPPPPPRPALCTRSPPVVPTHGTRFVRRRHLPDRSEFQSSSFRDVPRSLFLPRRRKPSHATMLPRSLVRPERRSSSPPSPPPSERPRRSLRRPYPAPHLLSPERGPRYRLFIPPRKTPSLSTGTDPPSYKRV